MTILKTAFKNIIGAGKKTWLNVFVLSFTMVIMVGFNALIDGWIEESRTETINWEVGNGQFWHPEYERYDIFTLQDAHGKIPDELFSFVNNKSVVPILIMQGTIYPEGRMQSILLKGIDTKQTVLEIPSGLLENSDGNYIPAIIGARMAKSANLKEGDITMLRWRDKNGVFDAREIIITGIFQNKVPAIDAGQIWVGLDDLYKMTGMHNEATILVKSENCPLNSNVKSWIHRSPDYLMEDLISMESAARAETFVVFILLMSLCLLAIFDTQTLSIFRRQKEIGTYIAMGMTPKKVIGLFTLEGTMYSFLAVIAGLIWGTPLLYLFAKKGFSMPSGYEDMIGTDILYPVYNFSSIAVSLIAIIILSALISYLPARKIGKQNVVYALKGKIQ